jgi:hypothetical protein
MKTISNREISKNMKNNLFKIMALVFCIGISNQFKAESPLKNYWIDTIEEEQLPMNTVGLAIILSDLYSYDPEGYTGFCNAIQYFIKHGCDITESFDVPEYLIRMYGSLDAQIAQIILKSMIDAKIITVTAIKPKITFNKITLLDMFLVNGVVVKALFAHGFQMKDAYTTLSLAFNQYKLACLADEVFLSGLAIQEIFNACDMETQETFLMENSDFRNMPEFKECIANKKNKRIWLY